jgi:hypothetical protein
MALLTDDTFLFSSDGGIDRAEIKLQRTPSNVQSWCCKWNVRIKEDDKQATAISKRPREPKFRLIFVGKDPTKLAVYLSIKLGKRLTCKIRTEMVDDKVLETNLRLYQFSE